MELSEAADRYLAGEIKDPEVLATLQHGSDAFGQDYFLLYHSFKEAGLLRDIPTILKRIIKGKEWRKWQWVGRPFTAKNLGEYLTKHPPAGIGTTLPMVEKLISDDPEALALFHKETRRPVGTNQYTDSEDGCNATTQKKNKAYWNDRLSDERPDLFERVSAGELSTYAATIEAGWRKPPLTPLEQLQKAWAKATEAERAAFRATICTHP